MAICGTALGAMLYLMGSGGRTREATHGMVDPDDAQTAAHELAGLGR